MLVPHQFEISHQPARIGKAREVAQLGGEAGRIDRRHAAHRLHRRHRGQRPVRQHSFDLRGQPVAPGRGGFDRRNVVLAPDMMHRLRELEPRQP